MDTLLENGDYKKSLNGLPISITGRAEIIQRVRICLQVPRGSFLHNKEFGSRFFELKDQKESATDSKAFSMAEQALENISQVKVTSASVVFDDDYNLTAVNVTFLLENVSEEVIIQL